jgi:hypothetical protein
MGNMHLEQNVTAVSQYVRSLLNCSNTSRMAREVPVFHVVSNVERTGRDLLPVQESFEHAIPWAYPSDVKRDSFQGRGTM